MDPNLLNYLLKCITPGGRKESPSETKKVLDLLRTTSEEHVKMVSLFLAHRIQSPLEDEACRAIDFARYLVKFDSSNRLLTFIDSYEWLNNLTLVLNTQPFKQFGALRSPRVKRKVCELLYIWTLENSDRAYIFECYHSLKKQKIIEHDALSLLASYKATLTPEELAQLEEKEKVDDFTQIHRYLLTGLHDERYKAIRLIKIKKVEILKEHDMEKRYQSYLDLSWAVGRVFNTFLFDFLSETKEFPDYAVFQDSYKDAKECRDTLKRIFARLPEDHPTFSKNLKAQDYLSVMLARYDKNVTKGIRRPQPSRVTPEALGPDPLPATVRKLELVQPVQEKLDRELRSPVMPSLGESIQMEEGDEEGDEVEEEEEEEYLEGAIGGDFRSAVIDSMTERPLSLPASFQPEEELPMMDLPPSPLMKMETLTNLLESLPRIDADEHVKYLKEMLQPSMEKSTSTSETYESEYLPQEEPLQESAQQDPIQCESSLINRPLSKCDRPSWASSSFDELELILNSGMKITQPGTPTNRPQVPVPEGSSSSSSSSTSPEEEDPSKPRSEETPSPPPPPRIPSPPLRSLLRRYSPQGQRELALRDLSPSFRPPQFPPSMEEMSSLMEYLKSRDRRVLTLVDGPHVKTLVTISPHVPRYDIQILMFTISNLTTSDIFAIELKANCENLRVQHRDASQTFMPRRVDMSSRYSTPKVTQTVILGGKDPRQINIVKWSLIYCVSGEDAPLIATSEFRC